MEEEPTNTSAISLRLDTQDLRYDSGMSDASIFVDGIAGLGGAVAVWALVNRSRAEAVVRRSRMQRV
jgi:hypothetical protein